MPIGAPAETLLEPERLVRRRFTDADVETLVELDSDPEVTRLASNAQTATGRCGYRATITARRARDHPRGVGARAAEA